MFPDALMIREHLHRTVGHHLDFHGSYRSMEAMAKVVNQTPNAAIKIPATTFKIKKHMQPCFSTETHIKCNRCSNYYATHKSETECELCQIIIKTSTSDYFIYIPIKQQLEQSVNRTSEKF